MAKKKRPQPCWKCGCKEIKIEDCGYSSFNVGWAECTGCGYKVKLSPCGCFPHNEIVVYWNGSKRRLEKNLSDTKKKVAKMKAELRKGAR